jgi:hypothetical protein
LHKVVSIDELFQVMEETLHAGGLVTLTSTGTSMLPMLKHQRDTVILEPVASPLHVNDVVLYRRLSGQFVLHRIVGLESNGDYILCGDNQFALERHISHRQVIGRLQVFIRKGRRISCNSPWYKAYVCLLPMLRLLRHGFYAGRRYMGAFKRRIRY